jgi:putative membrane protein
VNFSWEQVHPAINAVLNATCFVCLLAGRMAIASRDVAAHRKWMLRAFVASCVFLASYLTRFALTGAHNYPGPAWAWDRVAYLTILLSHMALAVVLVPLVLVSLRRGLRDQRAKHRSIVRFAWPIWTYVSVTGVIVYLMLYQLAPVLHPQ